MSKLQEEKRPQLSILGSNLSGGGALACVTLARALRHNFDIQIVGPYFGPTLWHGLNTDEFDVSYFRGSDFPRFFDIMQQVRKGIRGDLVIAYGVRLPSLGIAWMHRQLTRTPFALYVDEDDLALTRPGRDRPLRRRLASPNGDIHTRLAYRLRSRADATFCGSQIIADRFNGLSVPLGRNTELYDPLKFDRVKIRAELGIRDNEIVIGFMGNPRPHVGTDDLVKALELLHDDRYTLLVAPAGEANQYTRSMIARTAVRIRLRENEPSSRVPELLVASDIVVVPQRTEEMSLGQTPARLIEAMAMEKAIVSTRLANIPELLDDAGLLIGDRNPAEIAEALTWLHDHPEDSRRMAGNARQRFLSELSLEAMARKMLPELNRLLQR